MFGLEILDIIVIVVYFGIIIGVGLWSSRRIKNQEDYLLGGRKFGKIILTFASFGQATSADGPVGVATTTFRNGAAGIWSSLLMVFSTPMYWITSPWMRRMRVTTMGDFYQERYGSRKMAATYALVGTIGMMGLLSVGYTAMSKTILAIASKPTSELSIEEQKEYNLFQELKSIEKKDSRVLSSVEKNRLKELRLLNPSSIFSYINESLLIWIVCLVVLIYAVMGGLEAAFYVDLIQGSFIIILSIILIPFSWHKISQIFGNGSGDSALKILHEKLPESFFQIFGSPTLIDFTWYFILTAALIAGVTVVTQPNQLVTNAAAKDEYSARFGFVTGVFLKRFCTILWGVFGLAAILLYTGRIQNSDLLWGFATSDLLGTAGYGLVGLMIASLMAALMSTATTLMLTVSGLVVSNVYRPLVTGRSEKHYVWAGRVSGALFLIGTAVISSQFNSIFEILKFIWEFFIIFAAAFWLGLKWRRANRQGAWTSILSTLSIFYFFPLILPILIPSLRTNEFLLMQTESREVGRTYTARTIDVKKRAEEIEGWQKLQREGKASGTVLPQIRVGEKFTETYILPSKTIFWSEQPELNSNGKLEARGYFFPELLFLQSIGFELDKNSYAFNETIRMLIRLIFPFIILICVSLLTKPNDDINRNEFFLKMRTKVRGLGSDIDKKDIENSFSNPEKTKEILLFPNTNLEIYKWNKEDISGFMISILIVFIVIGALFAVVKLY